MDVNHLVIVWSLKSMSLLLWLSTRGGRCSWVLSCFVSISFLGWSIQFCFVCWSSWRWDECQRFLQRLSYSWVFPLLVITNLWDNIFKFLWSLFNDHWLHNFYHSFLISKSGKCQLFLNWILSVNRHRPVLGCAFDFLFCVKTRIRFDLDVIAF